MRLPYDFLTLVPDYRIITYGGDSCVSDEIESFSGCYLYGDATHFSIGDTGIGIFLMVPRYCALSYLIDTQVPGGKGS